LIDGTTDLSTGILNTQIIENLNDSNGNDFHRIASEAEHNFRFSLSEKHHVTIYLRNGSIETAATYEFVPIFSNGNRDDLWIDLGYSALQISNPLEIGNVPDGSVTSISVKRGC